MITDRLPHFTDWSTPAKSAWVVRERVDYERVSLTMRATPGPVLLGAAYGAGMALFLGPLVGAAKVSAWLLLLLGLSALRLWDVRQFRRDPQRQARAGYWKRRYVWMLVPYALCWSLMSVAFATPLHGLEFTVVQLGLLGVLSVGIYTTHAVFAASVSWVAGIGLPVLGWSLWQASQGRPALYAMGAGVLAFALAILIEARRSAVVQAEMLRLRLENAVIAEDRQHALLQAEQASRAKNRFLGTVSHEMRTPLNGIVGVSELIRDESNDPLTRERAGVVLQSAEQLHRVIGELLDLSRLEFGRLQLAPGPVEPVALLDAVLGLVRPLAAERHVVLQHHLDPAVPARVTADAQRVKQVLHAMLAHALAHTARGRIELLLDTTPTGLRVVVETPGEGLAAERAEQLFGAMDRADAPDEDRLGTGLGLVLARRLALAMGGDLRTRRQANGGCLEFSFAAPALDEPRPLPDAQARLPQLSGHVLVVDDNEVNALVAEAMLRRLGLSSRWVRDGDEALVALAEAPASAVLMDCRMPRLDGWETTRQWRKRESAAGQARRLPIIGVTANVSDEDRRRCFETGMDGFLAKPFRVQELAAALRPHLPGRAQAPG
jgi:two-component system, sensor histidine kinase